jgi:hypothetical protein
MSKLDSNTLAAGDYANYEDKLAVSFKQELPEKLRLLSFAAKNGDFTEVGFIAHHIHRAFGLLGASEEEAMALQLSKISTSNKGEAKQLVESFTAHVLSIYKPN